MTLEGRRPAAPGVWAVFAVRYGDREGVRGAHFHGYDPCAAEPHPTAYDIWLLLGADRTVLVDAGMSEARARTLPGLRFAGDAATLLDRLGIPAERVDTIVLTHLHYDHAGGADRFPRARVLVQRDEWHYWHGPDAQRVHDEEWLVEPGEWEGIRDRIELLDGDARLAPGLEAALVRGHTRGMQVVRATTATGPVVLASDASHFAENIETDRAGGILDRYVDVFRAFDRVRALAVGGVIVPGHDPGTASRHETIVTDPLVLRLG